MAYGMAKLFSDYAGNLARVVRRSDSATLNIAPQAANQNADMSGFAAFLGASTVGVDTFYDQSGSGSGDAVQATDGSRPSIFSANAWNGRQPITTGIKSVAGTTAGNINSNFLNRPAVNNSRQAVTMFWCGILGGGSIDSIGVTGLGTDAGATNNLSVLYDSTSQMRMLGSAFVGSNIPVACEPIIISLVLSGTLAKLRVNGVTMLSTTAQAAFTMVGGFIGKAPYSVGTIGPTDMFADITYAGALTDPEIAQVEAALAAIFDVKLTAIREVVFDGDSLTCGLNESGFLRNYPRQVVPLITGTRPFVVDYGTSGIIAATVDSRKATTYAKVTGPLYAGVTSKAYILWIGTNTIEALASGSIVGGETALMASISSIMTYMSDPTRFGSKVAVATIIPRGWSGTTADQSQKEVVRINVNNLIKASGYAVLDFGGIAALTTGPGTAPPNDAAGNINPAAAAYYGVNTSTHLNPAGNALCAAIAATWLNSVL